jgi:hypothetical protein
MFLYHHETHWYVYMDATYGITFEIGPYGKEDERGVRKYRACTHLA